MLPGGVSAFKNGPAPGKAVIRQNSVDRLFYYFWTLYGLIFPQ
jgi:hypothetical protein